MAGAVSALFLLDIKGRVLIWRDYRGDVTAIEAERFFTKLIEKEVHSFFSPIYDMIIYLTQHQVPSQLRSLCFSSCFEKSVSAVSDALYNVFCRT